MRRLKLMAEYGVYPIWDITGSMAESLSPDTLGLSSQLQKQLEAWTDIFDRTFDERYPPESGFSTSNELDDFNAMGLALADAIQRELGAGTMVCFEPSAGLKLSQ